MTIHSIRQIFDQLELKYQEHGNDLVAGFPVEDQQTILLVQAPKGGAIASFTLLGLIPTELVAQSKHKAAFQAFLLQHNWRSAASAAGQCVMNRDGEVRATVALPLADAQVTPDQIKLVLTILMLHGKTLVIHGKRVLEAGQTAEDGDKGEHTVTETEDTPQGLRAEIQSLIGPMQLQAQTPEGRARLEQVAADTHMPTKVRLAAMTVLNGTSEPGAGSSAPDEL